MGSNKNILLVWDRMGDYHRARWSALKHRLDAGTVYAADLGAGDNLYGWKNTDQRQDYFLLSTRHPNEFDLRRLFRFIKILREKNIGAVCIAGYGRPEYIFFIIFSWLSGRKVVLFAESWYSSSTWLDYGKSLFLRLACDGFLVSGKRAEDHFIQRMRVDRAKIRTGYSVVDNDHFSPNGKSVKEPGLKILLCVARFAPEKNLCLLIDTFINSAMPHSGWELVLVGGGPLESELARLARSGNVRLLPWQPYEKLPALYHQADAFILPSKFEPWGLVVNEAMAAGLPLILSSAVGCYPDLLVEGENGWSFHPEDRQGLAGIFAMLAASDSAELRKYGNRSQEYVKDFSVREFAENVTQLMKENHD